MSKETGGMAFPGFEYVPGHGTNKRNSHGDWEAHQTGMTLRDYFAAKALQGLLASDEETAPIDHDWAVNRSYILADKMLERRKV